MTPHFPEQKSIVPSMKARDTRPPTTEVSSSTWKNLSAKASTRNTFLRPEQSLAQDNQALQLSPSHNIQSLSTKWLSDIIPPPKTRKYPQLITIPVFCLNLVYFIFNQWNKMHFTPNCFLATMLMGVSPINPWCLYASLWECPLISQILHFISHFLAWFSNKILLNNTCFALLCILQRYRAKWK